MTTLQPLISIAVTATLMLSAGMGLAADTASVDRIVDRVKAGFSNFRSYCDLPDAERRQTVVKTTMMLAGENQVKDPFVSGAEAGNRLRLECGRAALGQADIEKLRWTVVAKPLEFNSASLPMLEAKDLDHYRNRLVLPAGATPVPIVILSHTAGGVSKHLEIAAERVLAAGFGVMVLDTYGPRGLKAGYSAAPMEFARDAYDALKFLSVQPRVDPNRIFLAGYSSGALAAALVADPASAVAFGSTLRFRASVGNYGTCAFVNATDGHQAMQFLSADSDRPVLMLMGELDIETPPKLCFPLLEQMKAAGKPVEWHIYPKTTHGWDKRENNGYVYRTTSGDAMTYTYDATVTQDATNRMIAFFNQHR